MNDMCVGDKIRDNDSRMHGRVLTITYISDIDSSVQAQDSMGYQRWYLQNRIYTDDKVRRTGFSKVRPAEGGSK